MATISIEDLFLVTLVLVDDWYQQKGQYLLHRTVGDKPVFRRGGQILCIAGEVAQDIRWGFSQNN